MSEARVRFSTTCQKCGHELPPAAAVCPGCGIPNPAVESKPDLDPWSQWSKAGKTMKLQWVAAVIAFWVSSAVLVVVYLMQEKLSLILVSVSLGMLVIGMWLKTRYQLHHRSEPSRPPEDVRTD